VKEGVNSVSCAPIRDTMSFKILSDFDGVWTDPGHEAASVQALMQAELVRLTGASPERVMRDFEALHALACAEPARFGWAPPKFTGGRVTAFVDEDPFCAGNAIASVLGHVADGSLDAGSETLTAHCEGYAAAILGSGFDRGFEHTSDFADHAFLTATRAYRESVDHALVERAHDLAMAILDAGIELVVVSNSSTDKLEDWFRAVDVPCYAQGAAKPAGPAAHLCGSAGKFILGDTDEHLGIAGRKVWVDRPQYRAVIEAENPDLIIGDVFSLDLALPAAMRAAGETAAPSTLVLRRHDYSPSWSANDRAGDRIDHVIRDLDELIPLAEAAASARS